MNAFRQLTLAEIADSARAARTAREQANYSDYGQQHGGSIRLNNLTTTVAGLAFGALALVLILKLVLHLSAAIVTVALLGIGFAAIGTNLALCARYLRRPRFTYLLKRCTLLLLYPASVLAIVLFIFYYVL
ncbi:MAG TPA: hypothetical protein VJ843_01850 [Candidatus Saccharimonadales bacterium]|nr:hypothetical protein [Candidatus Saccharimonadales bacterium]